MGEDCVIGVTYRLGRKHRDDVHPVILFQIFVGDNPDSAAAVIVEKDDRFPRVSQSVEAVIDPNNGVAPPRVAPAIVTYAFNFVASHLDPVELGQAI